MPNLLMTQHMVLMKLGRKAIAGAIARAIVIVTLCAVFSPMPLAEAAMGKQATHENHVILNGMKRGYTLHLPRSHKSDTPTPLVIVLHGACSTRSFVELSSKMSRLADKKGFIAVYPRGILTTWNAGGCCGPAKDKKIDDVAFIKQLILKLERDFNIDTDRIYVAGSSNGGMMAYRLACELSDILAAAASVDGCLYAPATAASSPVSIIAFHGTADRVVPFDGGRGGHFWYHIVATSVAKSINYWVERNHCSKEPLLEESGKIRKELYKNGIDGTEVCLYTIGGGHHIWPGGREAIISNHADRSLNASEIIWDFFAAHPKRAKASSPQERSTAVVGHP